LHERIKNVEQTGLANEIIVEEYDGQKISDIQKYNVDVFAIGSDWLGKFDYLNEYCKVEYLPRTKGISSTSLRNGFSFVKIGMIGCGNIASRFLYESKFVSNTEIVSVLGRNKNVEKFVKKNEINKAYTDFNSFVQDIDAVYIATPHNSHYEYTKKCLLAEQLVRCEKR